MTAQSATPTLAAKTRVELGRSVKALRANHQVPAVVYGHDKATLPLTVDQKEFVKVYNEAGSTTLVALKIDENPPVKVLIHDLQASALRNEVQHVDFYIVNLKEKLRTEVPLTFVGVADAVDILGGTLLHVKDVVEIECLPDDLVHGIEIDLSALKTLDDTITVADLVAPHGIVILDEPEQTLVSVSEPRSEEEMAALDEAPVAEVTTEFETEEGVKEAAAEGDEKKEE